MEARDFTLKQGKTFSRVLRWGAEPIRYIPISAITNTAPVVITCAQNHELPDGWSAAIVSVRGMVEINASTPPRLKSDYKKVTVVNPTTLSINSINASDFKPYVSGGYVQYYTPVDLTGYTARMTIRSRLGGPALLTLTVPAGGTLGPNESGILLDPAASTVTVVISAADTAAMTWQRGVYDLEMELTGTVTELSSGTILVEREVTTP
jgi:hypothetical protein